jgi:hypothetical protein
MFRKKITFWLHRFVMAYGIIMLSTFFMCLLFNPTSELPVVTFFGRCILFTLVCMATLIVYYSKEDLTPGVWWLRTVLHAILLEAVLLPLAHHWGFWYGRTDAIIYAAFILAAKIVWHLVDFGQCIRNAVEVNEKLLKRRRKEETNDE